MPDTPVLTPDPVPVAEETRTHPRRSSARKEPKTAEIAAAPNTTVAAPSSTSSPTVPSSSTLPTTAATAASASTPSSSSDVLLREMLEELRMLRRLRQHNDFSLGHLIGAIAQAFSICALGWALYAALGDYKMAYVDASLRVLFAIAFQMIALTGFLAGNRKG